MAVNSLDDKLLGEKVHYYCSSSEDEDDDDALKYDSDEENKEKEAGKSKPDSECTVQEEMDGKTNYTGRFLYSFHLTATLMFIRTQRAHFNTSTLGNSIYHGTKCVF